LIDIATVNSGELYELRTNCKDENWAFDAALSETSIGKSKKVTILNNYNRKQHRFCLFKGIGDQDILGTKDYVQILVTPYGWTFYEGKAIDATDTVWYTTDITDYLGSLYILKEIIPGRKCSRELSKTKCRWFDKVWEKTK